MAISVVGKVSRSVVAAGMVLMLVPTVVLSNTGVAQAGINDGNLITTYTVEQKALSAGDFSLEKSSVLYGSISSAPEVVCSAGLTEGVDYTVAWSGDCEDVGIYTATIAGKGNYTGDVTLTFIIEPRELDPIDFELENWSTTYTGKAITPRVVCSSSLEEYVDYSVTASKCKDVGTYTVTVKGKGNYTGTVPLTFTVKPAAQTSAKVDTSKVTVVGLKSGKLKTGKSFALKASGVKGGADLAWSKANKAGASKIKVSKSGKLTVAKGTKKGTYKVRVKLEIAAAGNYAAKTVYKYVSVVVK